MNKEMLATALYFGAFAFITVASAEERVVFRQDNHECALNYNTDLFVPGSIDADNHRKFTGPNSATYFTVTAAANDENMTPNKIRQEYIQRRGRKDLVYNLSKRQFLVLSGYRDGLIFYTKIVLSSDHKTICVLDIFYPRQDKRNLDQEVTRMSRSFRAPQ